MIEKEGSEKEDKNDSNDDEGDESRFIVWRQEHFVKVRERLKLKGSLVKEILVEKQPLKGQVGLVERILFKIEGKCQLGLKGRGEIPSLVVHLVMEIFLEQVIVEDLVMK
ncbi:Uncharacterized protein TCM_039950 [Theobroma cacao]|uniref:Uncharacterized protein n=1 Tax=Theobroma cacao TaxID=3641 RepID=A0A061GS82_THECC|nr:Uncharacterized protein TCM_039950 [Theobroma cacao]